MNEAVTVRKKETDRGEVRGLASGLAYRLVPVPQSVLQDAIALLEEPAVPMWANPEKDGRLEENPLDPEYRKAVREHQREVVRVTFDVFALFGIELVDGLPEDRAWLDRLRMAEKRHLLDLSGFDLEDPVDREFLFKRYVALTNEEYYTLGLMSGINPQEVRRAAELFRGDQARGADSELPAEGHGPDGDPV